MYLQHFGLARFPFTIAPDPAFLYPSPAHEEALAHLQYSLTGHGGLICLTGEVGTGKTTLCRAFLNQSLDKVRTAYVFNPQLSALELLQSLCDELGIDYQLSDSHKQLYDRLNRQLLNWYAQGERVIVVVDEAQSMPAPLLEQIRLLTNLETDQAKLLTLILVGQPELRDLLQQHQLRQLNQRITARYHLPVLRARQVMAYLDHRMQAAGGQPGRFTAAAAKRLWRASGGVPRLLNALADRALLGAYAHSEQRVSAARVVGAKKEILPHQVRNWLRYWPAIMATFMLPLLFLMAVQWVPPVALLLNSPVPELTENEPPSVDALSDPVVRLAREQGLAANTCDQLLNDGWRCLWVNWAFNEVSTVAFPALLQRLDDRQWQSPQALQANNYAGQALILWQPPPGYDGLLRPGENSTLVPWLRQRLGMPWSSGWQTIAPQGQAAVLPETLYDPLLANRIAQFQAQQGLTADRIVGPRTLLALQREGS
ncbi:ExeA family protein [Bacterioplanes sanyensis]|nr:AAA family ATPase [Bacterioplanes sanyensis]